MSRRLLAYQNSQVITGARGDILVSLFDGALRFVQLAKVSIEGRDLTNKARSISRATAILQELVATLDDTRAPKLCSQLKDLYCYMITCLQKASSTLEVAPIIEVQGHLTNLRKSWADAVLQARREGLSV